MSLAFNEQEYFLARFVLGQEGLRLTRLTNARGESAGFNNIGQSLLEPDKQ